MIKPIPRVKQKNPSGMSKKKHAAWGRRVSLLGLKPRRKRVQSYTPDKVHRTHEVPGDVLESAEERKK